MKKILVIEDNEDLRENVAEILELAGYEIHTAENGKLGVEKAEKLTGTLTIKDNKLKLNGEFEIALVDYKIDVPKLVFEKIAEKIAVKVRIDYLPYVKK